MEATFLHLANTKKQVDTIQNSKVQPPCVKRVSSGRLLDSTGRLSLVLCDDLEGSVGGRWEGGQREWVYGWIHVAD